MKKEKIELMGLFVLDDEVARCEARQAFTTLSDTSGCADTHWLPAFVANERGDRSVRIAALKNAAQACGACGDDARTAAVQLGARGYGCEAPSSARARPAGQ